MAQFGLGRVFETFSNISCAKAHLIQTQIFFQLLILLNVILEPIWEATMTGRPTMVQLNPSRTHEEKLNLLDVQDQNFPIHVQQFIQFKKVPTFKHIFCNKSTKNLKR